ncbi:MAG: SDR family NAD(P)-dependent oxidoreductase [Candidatus Eremiobacteraeota bacterium]|nr:SDR family NAD(P)-dependent oxidoreductase [Candidatus Eremiobacteraeota bacterium]
MPDVPPLLPAAVEEDFPLRRSESRTADDVLADFDVHGSRVLITGASAGMGAEIARALAAHGAKVVGTARNPEKAQAATASSASSYDRDFPPEAFQLIELDLSSLASVRACADTLHSDGETFDLVIANAGVMAGPKRRTVDGFETQFGVNHLGHFLLVNRIAGLLKPGGRVVIVSSAGHRRSDVDLQDPNFERTPYDEYIAYGRSKPANILFAVEFDRRHEGRNIRATAVHPGAVFTKTVADMVEGLGEGKDAALAGYEWKTVAQGASTTVWAGVAATADDVGSRYCEDCHVAEVVDDPKLRFGVRSYALSGLNASALWAISEELVSETF